MDFWCKLEMQLLIFECSHCTISGYKQTHMSGVQLSVLKVLPAFEWHPSAFMAVKEKKSRKKAFASEWSWSHWGFDSPSHFQTHIHKHVVPLHAQTAPSATPEEPNLHLCVRLFIEVRSCEILVEAWWAVLVHLLFWTVCTAPRNLCMETGSDKIWTYW